MERECIKHYKQRIVRYNWRCGYGKLQSLQLDFAMFVRIDNKTWLGNDNGNRRLY